MNYFVLGDKMNFVQHFEIAADDEARAQKFYETVFGWKFTSMGDMPYHMIYTAPTDENGMLEEKQVINGGMFKKEGGVNGPVVVITVKNAEEHLKKIEEAGGTKIMGPQQVGDMGIYGQFKDPEDNLMGVWQPLQGPEKERLDKE